MPPSRQPNRMPKPWNSEPSRKRDRVISCSPQPIHRNCLLKAKPFSSWRAIIVQIQSRVVGKNLYSRAHDEEQQEKIEKVLQPQPQRKTLVSGFRCNKTWIFCYERLNNRQSINLPGNAKHRDCPREDHGDQPENAEPTIADPKLRYDATLRGIPVIGIYRISSLANLSLKWFRYLLVDWRLSHGVFYSQLI